RLLILLPARTLEPRRDGSISWDRMRQWECSAPEHAAHARLVGLGDHEVRALLALRVAVVGDHAVPEVRRTADRLARAGELEALPRGTVRLHFGHRVFLSLSSRGPPRR